MGNYVLMRKLYNFNGFVFVEDIIRDAVVFS